MKRRKWLQKESWALEKAQKRAENRPLASHTRRGEDKHYSVGGLTGGDRRRESQRREPVGEGRVFPCHNKIMSTLGPFIQMLRKGQEQLSTWKVDGTNCGESFEMAKQRKEE